MKIGISSYCYHRYFGEVYEGLQKEPPRKMTIEDFIERANKLKVDGISIEQNYLPSHDVSYLGELKGKLDSYNLERVYSWGYPSGLEGGKNVGAYEDMIKHIEYAKAIGSKVMRVIGSSDMVKDEPRSLQIERLSEMFLKAVDIAKIAGIKLAQANHSDFSPDELLRIAQNVNSPYFGINFVTGNFFRVLTDPVEGIKKLAKYVLEVDVKDLKLHLGEPPSSWHLFASAPLGEGLVDNHKIIQILKNTDFEGILTVEIDYLHPDYKFDEDYAVEQSIKYLKEITDKL